MDLAVLERDALRNTIHVGPRERLVERHLIDLLLAVRRVRQLARHVAVVGEEQQPQRILVEPPHRIDALLAGALHQIHHRLVGVGIFERSDIALGLVEHQIDLLFPLDAAVVELHLVGRLHLRSQFGHDHAVDRNQSGLDIVVGLAARAESRLGDETVQADFARLHVGIIAGIALGPHLAAAIVALESARGLRTVTFRRPRTFAVTEIPLLLAVGALGPEPAGGFTAVGGLVAVFRRTEGFLPVGTRTILRSGTLAAVAARTIRTGPVRTAPVRPRRPAFAISGTAGRTARALVDGSVVFREVGIVRSTPWGMFARGVIGITPGTGATFDTFGGRRALALVACETVENHRRVAVVVFHFDSN